MEYIKLRNLNKSYEDLNIFNDFNCKFEKNRFNCLMGPSGIGKTTLLYILMGLDNDYTGNITGLKNDKISVIFQENRLLDNYTIEENINFVMDESLDSSILEEYLFKIGLDGLRDKKVNELSGGMKRRVSILRAVLKEADIYIFDEPFKDMDKKTQKDIIAFVKEELKGETVIFSSHDIKDAEYLDAKIVYIDK